MTQTANAVDPSFWRGRRVFITGHTGFKGAWLTLWLESMGAKVFGFALEPPTSPSCFEALALEAFCTDTRGDIRDHGALERSLRQACPDVVFHMAAQPLVRASFRAPAETFSINVMGSVHLLDALRVLPSLEVAIIATTDKVYARRTPNEPYREGDALGGDDPYSASKSGAELAISAYRTSYFSHEGAPALASARAGNVIGGGDWGAERLIPDAVRALTASEPVSIRSPTAIRPWQHVVDALRAYLVLAEHAARDPRTYARSWNFGPKKEGATVGQVITRFCEAWGDGSTWSTVVEAQTLMHEAPTLLLDSDDAETHLGWRPRCTLDQAIELSVLWYKAHATGEPPVRLRELALNQIERYGTRPMP